MRDSSGSTIHKRSTTTQEARKTTTNKQTNKQQIEASKNQNHRIEVNSIEAIDTCSLLNN